MEFIQNHGVPLCRFPFIACEIFTCDVDVIMKTLVEDEDVCFLFKLVIVVLMQFLVLLFSQLCVKLSFATDEVMISVQLMNLLFSFLKPDHPHGTLLAGYFAKVLFASVYF